MKKVLVGMFLSVFFAVNLLPVSVLAQESADEYYLYSYFDGKFSDPVERRLFELVLFSRESDENDTAILKNLTVACEENLFESLYIFLFEGEEYYLSSENKNGVDYFSYEGELKFSFNFPELNIWGDITDVAEGRLVGCSLEEFEVFSENSELISLGNGINDGLDKLERNFFEYSDDEINFTNENADFLSVNGFINDLYFNQDNQSLVSGSFTFQDGVVIKEVYLECRNGGLFDEVRFELDEGEYEMSPTIQSIMYWDYDDEKEMIEDIFIFRTDSLDIKLEDLKSTNFQIAFDVGEIRFIDEFPNCSSNIRFEFEDNIYGTSHFFNNGDLFQSYWAVIDIQKRRDYLEKAIEVLSELGIIEGYADGRFRPNTPINRAEFSKILAESYLDESELVSESCFEDVLEDDWFSKYVCALKRKGYVSGDDDTNQFRPSDTVNFAESMKMLIEVLEFDIQEDDAQYSIERWYDKYLTTAVYNGFYSLSGYEEPDREILRGDAFISLYLAVNLKKNLDLRENFVLAIGELADYIIEDQTSNQFMNYQLNCEANSLKVLEKTQNMYLELVRKDLHLDLMERIDMVDDDKQFWLMVYIKLAYQLEGHDFQSLTESDC